MKILLDDNSINKLEKNKRQKVVFDRIISEPGIKAKELSVKLNIPFSTIDKYIRIFLKNNSIERRGSKKIGGYFIKKANY